jgi:hypothetical protein
LKSSRVEEFKTGINAEFTEAQRTLRRKEKIKSTDPSAALRAGKSDCATGIGNTSQERVETRDEETDRVRAEFFGGAGSGEG